MKNDKNQLSQKPKTINQGSRSSASVQVQAQAQAQPNQATGTYTQKPMSNVGSYGVYDYNIAPLAYLYGQQTGYNANLSSSLGGYANATTGSQGYWPTGYGGLWTQPQQTASSMNIITPSKKKATTSTSTKLSPKPPLSSSKSKAKSTSNDTSVFDENRELKERISELEAQLGLDIKPMAAKKVFQEKSVPANVKPDSCFSTTTPVKGVKKDPETPLKIDTPIKNLNKHDRAWIQRYEELVAYQKTHGHNMVPSAFGKLGRWVSRQRQEKKKGNLSEERTAMLDALDFVWVAN